jgi:hypothetical protein
MSFRLPALILALIGAVMLLIGLGSSPARAQACYPVPHAASAQYELNRFWGVRVPICRLPDGTGGAFANRAAWVVTADQAWLDAIANRYGNWAATGVLAHEWGHMVQGNVPGGTAAELQADCLAGVFFRGRGLPPGIVAQFANLSLDAGDPVWSYVGHGLGVQRRTAVARGYNGLPAFNGRNLAQICPYSAF